MTEAEHIELAGVLHACRSMIVLSGYPSACYETLYKGWERHQTSANADCGKKRIEVVWLNKACSAALHAGRTLFS